MLPDKISLPLALNPCQRNRPLPFDKPNHLRHRILGGNRDHHVHLVRHQVAFFNPTLLLLGQFAEHFAQVPTQLPVQLLPATFRDKHHMVFALLSYGLGSPFRPSQLSPSCAWRLTFGSLRDGLRYLSNFYCLPGRAGGSPIRTRTVRLPVSEDAMAVSHCCCPT